jgi:hypothetical protein
LAFLFLKKKFSSLSICEATEFCDTVANLDDLLPIPFLLTLCNYNISH